MSSRPRKLDLPPQGDGVELTDRDLRVLGFVLDYMAENYVPATHEEIKGHFGFVSKEQSHRHVKRLRRARLLKAGSGGRHRAILPEPGAREFLQRARDFDKDGTPSR